MDTAILDVRTLETSRASIDRAAEVLRAGGLVAFPTETVYGLGANALDPAAVARIFEAKGRPSNNPLIVHIASLADVHRLVGEWPDDAARLAEHFWPGPLTLVLPRSALVPGIITAGGPTVAIRMPAHPVARALIVAACVPVAAPSANRSGQLSPTRAEHVRADLEGRIDIILDGGATTGGIESTVLDVTCRPARLLRPGLVTASEIEAVIGPITRPADTVDQKEALPSPGMLTRHYAPTTPLILVDRKDKRLRELVEADADFVLISRPDDQIDWPTGSALFYRRRRLDMPNDLKEYAAELYDVLHAVDNLHDCIIVVMPPETDEWLAIRDRLRRAAASE